MNILINFLLVIESLVALLLMLVILMQRPKSEGLGAAFGGGVTENIFGAQTTNVLTTITTWLASIFFASSLVLSVLYAHQTAANSAIRRELMKTSGGTKPSPPPVSAKAAAKTAAADAKAQIAPVPKGAASPAATPSSPSAAAAAIGVLPAGAVPASPSPAVSASPKP